MLRESLSVELLLKLLTFSEASTSLLSLPTLIAETTLSLSTELKLFSQAESSSRRSTTGTQAGSAALSLFPIRI